MNKNIYTCLVICSFMMSASCNKETELIPSPDLSSSSARLSQPTVSYFIGENFGGGIIFYLDKSGKHGLISTTADLEEPLPWSRKDTLNGARDTTLGAGALNSVRIYDVQGYPQYEADTYAALECLGVTLNSYQDWYLPSLGELTKLYQSRTIVGGFHTYSYWSSSESNKSKAWLVNFNDGSQQLQLKTAQYALRPIRKF